MQVIGLTGGIATGKSKVAAFFAQAGAAIFDADACVHELMTPEGSAFEAIARAFPQAVVNGVIHRPTLGALVFDASDRLAQLEAILHPLVRAEEEAFIAQHREQETQWVVLEVPLLFEKNMDALCDLTVTTECPPDVQYQRALSRAGMTKHKYEAIIAQQMSQAERRARADWVIPTGMSEQETQEAVQSFLRAITP